MILPSLVPFLVSTLRSMREKFSFRTFSICMTSVGPMRSSEELMTQPNLEYSRMDLASRMSSSRLMRGPERRKAMILRLSGSTMVVEIYPMGPEDWMLRMLVPIRREAVINIT